MNRKELFRKIKFTLFSISAGVIQFAVFTILTKFTNFSYWVCYLTALIASIVWNFTLNRKYTFRSASNISIAMFKVFLFYLVFTPISTILGHYLVETVHINEFIVTILNMLANFILEYLYQRYYVFKNSVDTRNN